MLEPLKKLIREAAMKRWAWSLYSPNATPAPLYRILNGRRRLAYMDIGANNGDFFQALREVADFETAILIEPLPDLAQGLAQRFPTYAVEQSAIGSRDDIVEFNEYPHAPYMSSLLPLHPGAPEHRAIAKDAERVIRVPQRTLDGIATEHAIKRLDLLKIDTQGSEMQVLAGGSQLLAATAAIWIEVSFVPLYERSCLFHDIHGALYEAGFRLRDLTPGWRTPGGELAQADALFVRI